ncbi:MAG: class II glutamine amidotransferase [Myxococcales bacterium]|nr:class II glutamine amidotransferase [Myxococcales bacterium]
MGRLVAYTANRRDGLEAALRFERHALRPPATKSEAAWGIAFYQGDEVLHKKRPLPAGSAPEWTDLGGGVSTDCALMHLREPTVGDFRTENTHPFRFRRWTFAHQGTVSAFAELREGLLDGLPDFLRRNVRGETDSELFFHHVLSGLHRRGALEVATPAREQVIAALSESAATLRAMAREHSSDPSGLTCVLTDGHLTLGLCEGAPLYYVERRGPLPNDEPSPRPGSPQHAAVLRYVMVTTGSAPPMNYQSVPRGGVVVVDRDLNVDVSIPHG